MVDELVPIDPKPLEPEEKHLLTKALTNVREEVRENTYIAEAVRVLGVKGYRSAIGSYWNAVIDDLRRKIAHRSLDLFNKEMHPGRTISTYEDFQDHVTDHQLIEGAYKIGVIGWEARKLLHHARETRHIFDGHPSSSEPSLIKVLDMINDCNKYVLSQEYPPIVIDIDTYLANLDSAGYHQNAVAAEQAVSDLPGVYRTEMVNKLYTAYQHSSTSTTLRGNIEFFAPILWSVLPKEDRQQIGRRLDRDFAEGDAQKIEHGLEFLVRVGGLRYVSTATRKAVFEPVIERLEKHLDEWAEEEKDVRALERLGTNVPTDLIPRYVKALTETFVGYKGYSTYYSRTDFYADAAAPAIKRLFEQFDDASIQAFVDAVKSSSRLVGRIHGRGQLNRLRILAQILLDRPGIRPELKDFLELAVDDTRTGAFLTQVSRSSKITPRSANGNGA